MLSARHGAIADGRPGDGVTIGGYPSVLSTSVGTTGSFGGNAGRVALLEDVDEQAYRLDSYLTQLRRSGWFDGVAGIALGSWAECGPAEPVVLDVLGDLGVPILGELGFGHGADPITVPLGVAPISMPTPGRSRWNCRRSPEPPFADATATSPTVGEMTETFHQRHLAGARFEQVDLTGATFQQVYLKDVVFRDVDISGVRIRVPSAATSTSAASSRTSSSTASM